MFLFVCVILSVFVCFSSVCVLFVLFVVFVIYAVCVLLFGGCFLVVSFL